MALPDGHPALDLRHYDRSQLIFQIHEVFERETYLQAGISVGPGDVVIDAGANVGVAAVMFALRGATAVHSFEPVLALYELLSENVAGYEACTAHNLGLSAREGEAEIVFYPTAAAMSGFHTDLERDRATVSAAMIHAGVSEAETRSYAESMRPERMRCRLTTVSRIVSEFSLERIDLLKIDVEGSEAEILRGIEDADWPRIAQIAAEVHDDANAEAIVSMLEGRGFQTTWIQDEALADSPLRMVCARAG